MARVQDLSTFQLPDEFRGRPGWYVLLWWLARDTLFAWSPQPLYAWRRWLLRLFGAKIGRNVILRPSVRITYPWKLEIGDNSWIGDFAELYNLADIVIAADVVVSQYAYLCTGSHDYKKSTFDIFGLPIHIEAEAWVASHVYVAPGVRIGHGAVIAARSTVLKDVPAMMLSAGTPARVLGPRAQAQETPL